MPSVDRDAPALPYAGSNASLPPELCSGPVARGLGILAGVMSMPDQSAEHFEDALRKSAGMGARPGVAHTEYDYARMLVSRGSPEDADRAEELLASCLAICRELGMPALEQRAADLSGNR